MNRSFARNLVLAAGLVAGLGGTAMAQTLGVSQPVINTNQEVAGPNTRLRIAVPDALNTNTVISGTEQISIEVRVLNAAGTAVIAGPFSPASFGGAYPNYANAGGDQIVFADLATVTFTPGTFVAGNRLLVTARSAASTGELPDTALNVVGLSSVINIGNEALDTTVTPDPTIPVLQNVFLNNAGDAAFFVFSKSLNNNDATNDNNHTVLANITAADFQVDTVNSFDGTEVAPTGLTNPSFQGTNRTVIRFDRNSAATTLNSGSFARPTFTDAATTPNNDIFDVLRNRPTASAVQVTAATPLAPQSASWLTTVAVNGANAPAALRVVFNNPLNNAGDVNAYDLVVNGAVVSNVVLSNFTIDPTNPNAVLIDVNSNTNDFGVSPDGRTVNSNGAASGIVSIRVKDSTGTDVQDLFANAFTGQTDIAATDAIAPTQVGAPAFLDTNRDGEQDGVAVIFDEPITDFTSAAGLQLTRLAGASTPFFLITPASPDLPSTVNRVVSGTLTNNLITPAAGTFSVPATGSGVSRTSIDADNNGTISARETNNAILITFNPRAVDWDNDGTTRASATPDSNEPVPGTGDSSAVQLFLNVSNAAQNNGLSGQSVSPATVSDANGNAFTNGNAPVNAAASQDRAAPAVATIISTPGDNQGASNDQTFAEQDGDAGDAQSNNRFTFVFGENIGVANTGDVEEANIRFGAGGINGFAENASFVFASTNKLALRNSNSSNALTATTPLSILFAARVDDASGNRTVTGDIVPTPRNAPYVTLQSPVDDTGDVFAAYLIDADNVAADAGFGFADRIELTFSQPLDPATVSAADFSVSNGTISTVTSSGNTVTINLTDGAVPMTSTVTVTYNPDVTPIAAVGGVAITSAATNNTVTAGAIPDADRDTQNVAIQDVVGTITNVPGLAAGPAPVGTKIYAMVATPRAASIRATHNNVTFVVDEEWDENSLEAMTNVLLGVKEFVYLGRDTDNFQFYRNRKDIAGSATFEDVIQLSVNSANLSNISFTGTGETANDRVSAGSVRLAWDVLRSSNGSIYSFYNDGYEVGGTPILSSAVTTDATGRFELHVSAPISAFDGISRLNSVGRPIILVVELPSGRRYAVSSLVSSVNGAPLIFNPLNRRQTTGNADNASSFNINLANVGTEMIYQGWNLVPFNRQGGFANTAGNRPVRPGEVDEAEIVVPTTAAPLPLGASAVDQFVLFNDDDNDGFWTSNDDGGRFDAIVIDADTFRHFAFTMTSFGVQIGSGINNLVGGYALGFFNNDDFGRNFGVFQFGAPFANNVLFPGTTAANTFPNSATTQGWALVSSKTGYATVAAARNANTNPDLDYIIYFRNNGPNAGGNGLNTIEVQSADLTSPDNNNTNDLTAVPAGQAFFGHFQP